MKRTSWTNFGTEELAASWRRRLWVPGEATAPTRVGELASDEAGEAEAEANSSEEEVILSAKKLKTVECEASYVVASTGGIFTLQRAGSYDCWTGIGREISGTLRNLRPSPRQEEWKRCHGGGAPLFFCLFGVMRKAARSVKGRSECMPVQELLLDGFFALLLPLPQHLLWTDAGLGNSRFC